jgi:hypothetical protein
VIHPGAKQVYFVAATDGKSVKEYGFYLIPGRKDLFRTALIRVIRGLL